MDMIIEENWAVSIERVQQFFTQQPDILQTPEGFEYADCRITLTGTQSTILGHWNMPRTWVRMEGSDEDVRAIHRRFYLRFLSAGG